VENNNKKTNRKNYPDRINLAKNNMKFPMNQSQIHQSFKNDHERLSYALTSYRDYQPIKPQSEFTQHQIKPIITPNLLLTRNGNSEKCYQSFIKDPNQPN
jgi:hypothetical protein